MKERVRQRLGVGMKSRGKKERRIRKENKEIRNRRRNR